MKQKKITMHIHLKVTMLVVFLLFFLVVIKMAYVAVSNNVDGINLSVFAENRNTVKKVEYASRGSIYDANGDLLAQSVNSYTVFAYLSSSRTTDPKKPQHVEDIQKTAEELSPILDISVESLVNSLSKDLYQIDLKRGVTETVKQEIEKLELPGIDFVKSKKRSYQMGSFASYIIGYAKRDDDGEITGEMGIEKYYDSILKGEDGYTEYQSDAYGYPIPNTPQNIKESKSGSDIYLTLDNDIQQIVENAVTKISNARQLDWVTFSVMDAKSGAIVASASNPSFDLNTREGITSYLNPLTSYQYEPGSVMKIFSFMSSIEEGLYDGTKKYMSGTKTLKDGTIIKDFNDVGWGEIDYDTGFAYSSNVAATNLGLELGVERLKSFYQTLGFGSKTGITLPGEYSGQVDFLYESELANAAFGQGMTVTPIQMLQALSVLANDGVMIKPYIVSKIVDADGNVTYEGKREEVATVAKKETIDQMKELMWKVVYDGLSSTKAYQPKNVTLIGKTGTAQIASSSGGYMKGKYDYIKSFAGLFPKEDPKYVIFFSVKRLVGTTSDMAEVISESVEEIAKYAGITKAESVTDTSKIITLNNYISKSVEEVTADLQKQGLEVIVIGNGKNIIEQYPKMEISVVHGDKVFLVSDGDTILMPNAIGWSSKDIGTYLALSGISYVMNDYGKVVSTNIAPGSVLLPDTEVVITLGAYS